MRRLMRQAHNKVRILAAVLLGIVVAVALVASFGMVSSRSHLHRLVGAQLPAETALDDLDRNLLEADRSLDHALRQPTAEARVRDLEHFDRSIVRARAAWEAFGNVATHSTRVHELSVGYETMLAAWVDLTSSIETVARANDQLPLNTSRDDVTLAGRRFDVLRDQEQRLRNRFYETGVQREAQAARDTVDSSFLTMLWAVGLGLAFGFVVVRTTIRATIAQQQEIARRDLQRESEARRSERESRVQRALEMAPTEDRALDTLTYAMGWMLPGTTAELLLADSSRAHVRQALTTDPETRGPGCAVGTPSDCPAVARGQTLVYDDSTAFDACPQLRDRGCAPCRAVCVPVSIMGQPAGVLHATGPHREAPSGDHVSALELIAARAGERIGLLRAFTRSETQAATDPMTGLANRRTVEDRVRELTSARITYAVAYADLDRFKLLNDTHGHEIGDRALRLFARTLRDSVRPSDIVGRWGGEEFIIVLPELTAVDAVPVLERIREALALACTNGTVPAFTVSFGVADIDMTGDFESLVNLADAALLSAKRAGRNRVVVAELDMVVGDDLETVS